MSEQVNPIKLCEEKYPETTAEFKKILKEQYEIFCRKQLNDKIQRLKQLVLLGKEDTVGESVQDTYQDLSVYNIIAQIVIRGKWAK